jgi:hypothetical protein
VAMGLAQAHVVSLFGSVWHGKKVRYNQKSWYKYNGTIRNCNFVKPAWPWERGLPLAGNSLAIFTYQL